MGSFPSLRWPQFSRILEREPLGYHIERQDGSHRKLTAPGRPDLWLSFHDNQTLPPGLVRKILVNDVGLSEAEAWELVRG